MAHLVTRTISCGPWKDWGVLKSFVTYIPRYNLSTMPEMKQEIIDDNIRYEIDPLSHPDFFHVHNMFTVKDLVNAKVHFGHKEGSLDDRMRPFLFGSRLGYLIFDLDQTAELLRDALNFVAHIAARDGLILFISKNPQFAHLVETTAKECKEYAHTRTWELGTFVNAKHQFTIGTRLPDLCIFINTMESVAYQHVAVTHAAKMAIPTVGIVDTNCNPNLITYPVPGNDDSLSSIELYCQLFKTAIMRGKAYKNEMKSKKKLEKQKENTIRLVPEEQEQKENTTQLIPEEEEQKERTTQLRLEEEEEKAKIAEDEK